MERRYLTVFIAILVVALVAGIVWNAILDISNYGQIKETIRTTFDLVKNNKAEGFVEQTKLACSMIYGDYGDGQFARKLAEATDLYVTLRGMTELKSVSIVKIIERTTCLAAVTFTSSSGGEVTRHMILAKYEDRFDNREWIPIGILTIEEDRKQMLEKLRNAVDSEKVRKQVEEQGHAAIAGRATQLDASVSRVLANARPTAEIRAELVEKAQEAAARVESAELAEEVKKEIEKAISENVDPSAILVKMVGTPKARYLRLVARLKAIGDSEKKEAPKALTPSAFAQLAGDWSVLGTTYAQRYAQAAKKLAGMAASDGLKAEAGKLAETAEKNHKENRGEEQLPDLNLLAGKVKEELLGKGLSSSEKLEALAKLGRTKLQTAKEKEDFFALWESVAKEAAPDFPKLIGHMAGAMSAAPAIVRAMVAGAVPGLVTNEATKACWDEYIRGELLRNEMSAAPKEIVEMLAADALDGNDLFEARAKALNDALQVERNRRSSIKAKMRERVEMLIGSFAGRWAAMKDGEEYMKWAFPGGMPTPETSGLSESRIKRIVGRQQKFAADVVGKKLQAAITHHWYPDPEGFSKTAAYRIAEIVRVRFQTNPGVEEGQEEYVANDFMMIQEMSSDWSIGWKLFRVCDLYEYGKCRGIAQKEWEKRKAYFADGKAR